MVENNNACSYDFQIYILCAVKMFAWPSVNLIPDFLPMPYLPMPQLSSKQNLFKMSKL